MCALKKLYKLAISVTSIRPRTRALPDPSWPLVSIPSISLAPCSPSVVPHICES